MPTVHRTIEIIGVPSDLGANIRGSNMGPSALRVAGLAEKIESLGYRTVDTGDIQVPVRETIPAADATLKYLPQVTKICQELATRTQGALQKGHLPLALGGEHSLAAGSMAGVHSYFHHRNEHFGLIWIDAHGDVNTPQTSPSGNLHGMPLAVLLGEGHAGLVNIGASPRKLKAENVALVGIRTLDAAEKETVRKCGIRYFTMREIDERGMFAVMKDALAIATKDTAGIHLSFDLDGVDPLYAPGVSTAVNGGLDYREAHLAMEMISDTGKLRSMDLVELNPMTDVNHKTALLAIELIQSALGKSIV